MLNVNAGQVLLRVRRLAEPCDTFPVAPLRCWLSYAVAKIDIFFQCAILWAENLRIFKTPAKKSVVTAVTTLTNKPKPNTTEKINEQFIF